MRICIRTTGDKVEGNDRVKPLPQRRAIPGSPICLYRLHFLGLAAWNQFALWEQGLQILYNKHQLVPRNNIEDVGERVCHIPPPRLVEQE